MHITVLAGSPRPGSLSRRVALHLQTALEAQQHEVLFVDMQQHAQPPIHQVWTDSELVPEPLRPLYSQLLHTQALVFVSPEYNGGYSPALKNFLDHFPKTAFYHKAVGLVTASPGAMGGMRAALQLQLLSLGLFGVPSAHMLITPQVEHKFDEHGGLLDASFAGAVEKFQQEFLWLAERLQK